MDSIRSDPIKSDRGKRNRGSPLDAVDASRLEHVEADHGIVVEDDRVVGLDEAHAAHIGGEIEDMIDIFGDGEAVIHDSEVDEVEFMAKHVFGHVLILLPIRCDDVVALALEAARDVRCNEAAGPRDGDAE